MIRPEYKRDYDKSNMIFVQGMLNADAYYQQQMLLSNHIDGLLDCSLHSFNGEKSLFYDISGKQSLLCLYEKKQMTEEDIRFIIEGIYKTVRSMQEYMMHEDHLLLSPEFIYVEVSVKKIYLCFLPCEEKLFSTQLIEIGDFILDKTNHEDQNTVVLAYQFFRMVKESEMSFSVIMESLFEEKKVVSSEKEEIVDEKARIFEGEEYYLEPEDMPKIENEKQVKEKSGTGLLLFISVILIIVGGGRGAYCFYYSKEYWSSLAIFVIGIISFLIAVLFSKNTSKDSRVQELTDEDNSLELEPYEMEEEMQEEKDDRTVLLADYQYSEKRQLVLQNRKKTTIPLSEFPFIIGSDKEQADYALGDKSVSHLHAKFTFDEDSDTVFVQDLNSTNGIFCNGLRIESNIQVPIYSGDEIRLGQLSFVYE